MAAPTILDRFGSPLSQTPEAAQPVAVPTKAGMHVLEALQQCRMEILATDIHKLAKNEFSDYQYMKLEHFLPQVMVACSRNRIVGRVNYTAQEASLTITSLIDGSVEVFTCPMSSAKLKAAHEVQNQGATMTYIRRYLWQTAMEIVEHDAIEAAGPPEVDPKKPVDSPEQAKERKQAARAATFADQLEAIAKAQTMEKLIVIYKSTWQAFPDTADRNRTVKAYEKRKAALAQPSLQGT